MTYPLWYLLIGLLMLSRGLSKTSLQKFPITPAIVYLAIGFLLGPSVLHLFYFDPIKQSALLEVLTEIAVLISLFSAGVKMPVPFRFRKWRLPLQLASLSMVITIGLITVFSVLVLHLPIGAGVLLGAMLASTDPVLATDAQSRYPGDRDQLRFTLTCEAGINDGTAFPFVMLGLGLLGLHQLGDFGWLWLLKDVIWSTSAAVVIGIAGGVLTGITVWKLRGQEHKHDVLDDLVALGLIALVYGLCLLVSAWGFLAVFFAAVALRHTELKLAKDIGVKPEQLGAGVEEPTAELDDTHVPAIVSAEALVFKEHLERLSELMLVLLVGGMLLLEFWNWRTISLAMFIFVIARPVSVLIGSLGTQTPWRIQGTVGWFGVRGIGSIFYLMYALQHGLQPPLARDLTQLTLIVVALSILVHGISVKPVFGIMKKDA